MPVPLAFRCPQTRLKVPLTPDQKSKGFIEKCSACGGSHTLKDLEVRRINELH